VIQLSFDDGPSEWTPAILDLLYAADVQAHFFVCGASIAANRQVLERAADEGHTIGNHSYSHRRLPQLCAEQIELELAATSALIEVAVGPRPALYRAPYLERSALVDNIAAELGLAHYGADVQPDDWASDDAEATAAICLAAYRENPAAVICLHDGVPPHGGSARCTASRAPTVEAVRLILEGLR
jgi:peptidoglycan-N-acetylglucosamine deacetylase